MGDKSCYMGAGGYQAPTSNGSGYTREEYAYDSAPSAGASTNVTSTSQGGGAAPQVFKARTDQSAYMSPN